jgi:hypothetical protein
MAHDADIRWCARWGDGAANGSPPLAVLELFGSDIGGPGGAKCSWISGAVQQAEASRSGPRLHHRLRYDTIRKITLTGVVPTLGIYGTDGTDTTARFSPGSGLATNGAGNLYIADEYIADRMSQTARKLPLTGIWDQT